MIRRGVYKAHGQPDIAVLDNGERVGAVLGTDVTTIGPWIRWQLLLNNLEPTYVLVWDFQAMLDYAGYRHQSETEQDYPRASG